MARNKKATVSLVTFMNHIVAQLEQDGRRRTAQHYRAALNSFMRYRGGRDLALGDMDADLVQSYEAYLKNVAKVCLNTSSFYLRVLRATYNRAAGRGLVTKGQNPFRNVYTGVARTRKRAIPAESVSLIRHPDTAKALTPGQELARDTFLMCFYLRGISFIDLAHLRKSDLRDGYLHYTRSKTGQRLSVRWEREMQEIVDKYQAQTASSPYLLPFLASRAVHGKPKDRAREEARLYHNAEARIAYHLKKLGARLGIKGRLTLYVARHTWATAARDHHVPVSVISEALGHNSEATTQIYLRSIQSSEVDEANALLLAVI